MPSLCAAPACHDIIVHLGVRERLSSERMRCQIYPRSEIQLARLQLTPCGSPPVIQVDEEVRFASHRLIINCELNSVDCSNGRIEHFEC